jgi:hypothetical protein
VCATILKKICRKNGIARWPHRKIRSLDKAIANLEMNVSRNPMEQNPEEREELLREIELLKEKRAQIIKNPNIIVKNLNNLDGSRRTKAGLHSAPYVPRRSSLEERDGSAPTNQVPCAGAMDNLSAMANQGQRQFPTGQAQSFSAQQLHQPAKYCIPSSPMQLQEVDHNASSSGCCDSASNSSGLDIPPNFFNLLSMPPSPPSPSSSPSPTRSPQMQFKPQQTFQNGISNGFHSSLNVLGLNAYCSSPIHKQRVQCDISKLPPLDPALAALLESQDFATSKPALPEWFKDEKARVLGRRIDSVNPPDLSNLLLLRG